MGFKNKSPQKALSASFRGKAFILLKKKYFSDGLMVAPRRRPMIAARRKVAAEFLKFERRRTSPALGEINTGMRRARDRQFTGAVTGDLGIVNSGMRRELELESQLKRNLAKRRDAKRVARMLAGKN